MIVKAGRDAWRLLLDLFLEGEPHDRMHEVACEVGLSPGLLKALVDLPGRGTRMSDLAGHWGCDASYVTSVADALEARGFVERAPHPTDRRAKSLVVTPEGTATLEHVFSLLYEPPRAFGELSAAEQRQLRDLVRKLIEADQKVLPAEVAEVRSS